MNQNEQRNLARVKLLAQILKLVKPSPGSALEP